MRHLWYVLLGTIVLGCVGSRANIGAAGDEEAQMAAGHVGDRPVATPAATTAPAKDVTEERVAYAEVAGKPVFGYLARPKGLSGPLPGLIVIHEWWGLNDNVRAEARRLAAEGYITLAVDLYGGQTATEPPAAAKMAGELSRNTGPADENLRQAYAYLDRVIGAPRIGAIGWCLGGRWSLRAALLLPDQVDATVIYYGSVAVPETELARLRMPILGLFAEKDRAIPLPTVKAFEETMTRLGKTLEIRIYAGAEHAFANPSGTAYQAEAAADAWRRTLSFLRRNLATEQS
jgi:carboxymethylenebutenolidase